MIGGAPRHGRIRIRFSAGLNHLPRGATACDGIIAPRRLIRGRAEEGALDGARAERLKAELRENLKRRKVQARLRGAASRPVSERTDERAALPQPGRKDDPD